MDNVKARAHGMQQYIDLLNPANEKKKLVLLGLLVTGLYLTNPWLVYGASAAFSFVLGMHDHERHTNHYNIFYNRVFNKVEVPVEV